MNSTSAIPHYTQNQTLRTIHLTGLLKKLCGGNSTVQLVATNMAEAVSGLEAMFGPEVKQAILNGKWRLKYDDSPIMDESDVQDLQDTRDIFIFPWNVKGGISWGKVIIGVILVVVGVALTIASGGAAAPAWYAAVGSLAGSLGMALIMAGLQTLPDDMNSEDSWLFSGPTNTVEEGATVPLVFGRVRTGSLTINSGTDVEQMGYRGQFSSNVPGNQAPDSAFDIQVQ